MNTEVLYELGFFGSGKSNRYRKHWHTHCLRSATRREKVGIQWETAVEFAGRCRRTICSWYSWSKKIDVGSRLPTDKFVACSGIWWCEMDSDSENSSEFSAQWSDGWSTGSEADECETVRQSKEVDMTLLDTEGSSRVADDAKDQGSSWATVRSVEEPNNSNRCEAGVTAEDLAIAEFDSVEEAYARYVEYARVIGFAVRKGDSGRDNEGNVVRKFFFCNREGCAIRNITRGLIDSGHTNQLQEPIVMLGLWFI
ncbi:hypothetical protein Ahy_A09g046502 [Arachis hypogaea]|uniref:FAR1 domain-containing protein n=1 Tax=Arachis hypogaea TaxID=3818 RepID=A0A445BQ16_ARAHY|nr:hypothetical protein Ahy_A09g046502 [Arachis hypogaea]